MQHLLEGSVHMRVAFNQINTVTDILKYFDINFSQEIFLQSTICQIYQYVHNLYHFTLTL